MTPAELRAERAARKMSGPEFGAFLAGELGRDRAFSRQEVNAWESGARDIPALVELALKTLEWESGKRRGTK
jgi:DNA-binding transcriptional regulator YiaG